MNSKHTTNCKLVTSSDYVNYNRNLEKAEMILSTVGNLKLVGETGVGKTMLVYKLSQKLKLPLYEVVLTKDTSRWELLASDILDKGETKVRDGIVLMWLKAPKGILYLDGFNYAEPSIISLIESIADFRGNCWISETQNTYERGEQHKIIISYNPAEKIGYSGTFIENIATLNRFEGLVIDYMDNRTETKILEKITKSYEWSRKFVELGNKTRTLYREGKLRTPITLRNLKNYANMHLKGLTDDEIIEIASSLFPDEERGLFRRLFEESEPAKLPTDTQATPYYIDDNEGNSAKQ